MPRLTFAELTALGGCCSHPRGVHVLDNRPPTWGDGDWARLFDKTWALASGQCAGTRCGCTGFRRGTYSGRPVTRSAPDARAAAERLRDERRARDAARPCNHGPGPCGKTPTRLFVDGPKCAGHEPVAVAKVPTTEGSS